MIVLKRINLNNLAAYALIAAILCFYEAAALSAHGSYSIFPAFIEYKEDLNKDGQADVSDVVSLIALGLKIPESPLADYNGDSVFKVVDVLNLLLNVKNGKLTPLIPQNTSSSDTPSSDTTTSDTTLRDTTGTQTTRAGGAMSRFFWQGTSKQLRMHTSTDSIFSRYRTELTASSLYRQLDIGLIRLRELS